MNFRKLKINPVKQNCLKVVELKVLNFKTITIKPVKSKYLKINGVILYPQFFKNSKPVSSARLHNPTPISQQLTQTTLFRRKANELPHQSFTPLAHILLQLFNSFFLGFCNLRTHHIQPNPRLPFFALSLRRLLHACRPQWPLETAVVGDKAHWDCRVAREFVPMGFLRFAGHWVCWVGIWVAENVGTMGAREENLMSCH